MKVDVKVPSMGESITEATVANIIKSSGSHVAMDDEILELETDKVNQVLYAPQAGILNLNVKPQDKVKIGQVLGYVETEGAEKHSGETPEKNVILPEKNTTPSVESKASTQKQAEKIEVKPLSTANARLGKEDFLKDLQAPYSGEDKTPPITSPSNTSALSAISPERETRRKMSGIRKVIASRMVEVKNTTAMLTTFNEVDMSAVMGLRDKFKEDFLHKQGVKLGLMSFFVKACVSALKQFPDINSYIEGDEIVHREFYDIGMAVGTDRGVIVPVVRNCDQLSYAEIERSIEGFAKKAREGSISVDDLQGGSFTITNGGIYGSMLSTPIINPGQSAILGLHKITKRAVVVDDQIVIRPIMYLALSYDHRIVDGKEAVSFLVHVKNHLEYPGASALI
ncbi:MAG: 2-oxoglutarate dehydrogenase [Chlamydiales bacterium 38-26]|nr:2-oxoglutarate dehydrogenase complex dihydrolipoyllysine-residue succinyltransferase [Chlamydiales bacterium]OJV07637.1 MAG: 2-oxoglutarate dehydrogenase [Chlamydiales bacterium 38-26]